MTLVPCPCCGGRGSIDDIAGVELTATQRTLYQIVMSAGAEGIDPALMADKFYAGHKDGGPYWAEAVMKVHIHHMNKRLAAVGQRVKATNRGPGARYRVVSL